MNGGTNMRHANSSTTWRWFLLLGTLILALGLAGHGRWLASAQPMDIENGPLHPLSQQGLIPPVYLLNEGQLDEAIKSLNVNSGLWNPIPGHSRRLVARGSWRPQTTAETAGTM